MNQLKSKKTTGTASAKETTAMGSKPLFDRENLLWMGAGAVVMILGFILMAGGKSQDPNVFNKEEVYSATRITIAPILILAGLVILIFALFRQPKKN